MHAHLHLLDRQVVEHESGRLVAKVDDVELDLDAPVPTVTALLSGPGAWGPRLPGVIGRAVTGIHRRLHPAVQPEPTRIEANTQATFDDLRIGIGNIWEEEYTPEGGERRRGATAGMWLYFRDDPSQDRHVRIHPGQRVTAGGRTIEVVTVDAGSATLRVSDAGAPAKR